jgi:hypothetical protein
MEEIVDHALQTYGLTRELDDARVAQSREKIIQYIDKLGSAVQNLKELHEGPDPRFTGC